MTKHAALAFALISTTMAAATGEAAPLRLGCSGTTTSMDSSKPASLNTPEMENIADLSLVVDVDQRQIYGLWLDQAAVPITATNPNSVTFEGDRRSSVNKTSIEGTLNRVTGIVDATTISFWNDGRKIIVFLNLRCKPTRPMF